MPTWRLRPLTWLFWIATLCATLTGWVKNPDADWLTMLLLAQVYVVSGWAAVGKSHRLVKGAALVLAPLTLALVTYASQRSPDEGAYVLAFAVVLGGLVFIATRAIVHAVCAIRRRHVASRWRVSIVEMLGWTIVVALGSWAISLAKLPPLEHIHALWETLASTIPPSIMMGLFLAPPPRHDRASLLLTGAGLAAFYVVAQLLGRADGEDHGLFASLFGYVAFWILVVRLDENAAPVATPRAHSLWDDD